MKVLDVVKKHKNSLFIITILFVIILTWTFISSFSETTTSSAWDGVVAKSFKSGTGTSANPYVISNASEYAYFKELLESENATIYLNKTYKISNSFNYGSYDISINNTLPFTGVIDGNGKTISNAVVTNALFNSINGATIKNIAFDLNYTLNNETGGVLANTSVNSTIDMVLLEGNINVKTDSTLGGIVYTSESSRYNNIVLNYNISNNSNSIYKVAYKLDPTEINNILVKDYDYAEDNITVDTFKMVNNSIELIDINNLNNYRMNNYAINIVNNHFAISEKTIIKRAASITEHSSGVDGTTVYVNDISSDYNYLKGLNYTEVRSTTIPSGVSTGYYDDEYLVKVQIIYDGADINNSSLVGSVSPINNENANKYVYFKYYPLERNSDGSLATDANNNNYIHIELIDNPFSKRPYVNSIEYGFNGWVCNPNVDTTDNLCDNATLSFNADNYTRYLDIPVDGGSEIIIHLNASWYEADVTTSYNNINSFNSRSMQRTSYTTTETITHSASYYWKQNYTQMKFTRTYERGDDENGYIPARTWYRTSSTSGTYTYVSGNYTRCPRNRTCYGYVANTSAITAGSKYEGGTVTFVANFRATGNNTDTTIYNYNTNYMELRDDPDGNYSYNEQVTHTYTHIPSNGNASGFYYQVSNPTNSMIQTGEYYNSSGVKCTSTTGCNPAYKLIQYNDLTNKSNGNSISLIERVNGNDVDANRYYYLVTRDMNIFRYTDDTGLSFERLEINRPFTITGTEINGTSSSGILEYPSNYNWFFGTTYSDFAVANDLVIENIKIDGPDTTGENNTSLGGDSKTSQVIYANSNNLKIGRNVTSDDGSNYLIAESVFGGSNNDNVDGTFKVIIESGNYYSYHSGAMSGDYNYTLNETTILGSDYDRVRENNDNLKFIIGLDGFAGGHHTAGNDSLFASYTIVKSGTLGYNSDGTPNSDNTAGMYIGGRASTCVNSLTGAKVEGGKINTIVGGYGYNGTTTTNSTYIGMSGGTVREIYGGAGHSTTKGNRIINVTGGTVSYSVLGGSDSYSSLDTDDGVVQGSTLVYVGGNTKVGDGSTDELNGVESGSVFGAGGGNSNPEATSKGTVYNSHVIINGGTIAKSVYGGGNFGSVGTQSTTSASTVIDILSGNIGNIYGGSKSAGFSKEDYLDESTIDINVYGGTINNIYGGSNTKGDIYGLIDMNITGGTINGNIYGGGQGGIETGNNPSPGTTTLYDVSVTIGNESEGPKVNGNVYGGSAFGSVNGQDQGNVAVTVNNGTITGYVFGGGEGDRTHTPIVNGNITVTINGGDITSVFGGNDQAGSHTKLNNVYLNGGTIDSVYGGGNKSSVTNTHVYENGSVVTNIYGGSNTLGDVSTTTVNVTSGTVLNVYGGNNEGGSCETTNVLIDGTASVTGSVYGGGNKVNTTTTNVTLNSATGTIPNVYGGGNSASVTTSNIEENGINVTNMFGGSNSSGTVNTSIINYNNGTTTNVYGGNNAGGNTITSNITMNNGTITNIYGGGNEATGDISNVTINGGTTTNLYGGGNNAGLTTSNINIKDGTATNVYGGGNNAGLTTSNIHMTNGNSTNIYGGSNNSGLVNNTNVLIDNTSSEVTIYGGGNKAEVGSTKVTINNGTINTIYGGGNLAKVTSNTIVDINGGTINHNVYGGGNFGVVSGNSNVTITNSTILGSAYAGGNGDTATLEGSTNITIDGNTIIGSATGSIPSTGSVFGGGNKAATGLTTNNSTSTVNIVGATIYGNVYGGANTSVINGNTIVNIGNSVPNINDLTKGDIYIKGHIFGGGEANESGSETYDWFFISVTEGTNINIDASGYSNFKIDGSFYGGGNASSASGDSYLLIKNYGTFDNPKKNISIQRVTYAKLDNSSIVLKGAIDRANDYDKELFSISRVNELKLKNNSALYLETGANLLENFYSVDNNENYAVVNIDVDNNSITNRTVNNRIYMYEGKNLNIAKDQQVTDYGEVKGMTFLGIFNYDNSGNVNTGIYNNRYNPNDLLDWSGTFSKGSYVLGSHLTNHDITKDGFYSNFINEETTINEVNYIEPTPSDARFYMWYIGENVIEYNVNLTASKYSTLGSVETSFLEFSKPNTSFQILSFDSTELAEGISLIDKNDIPRIASNENDANNKFGLAMEASNSGWLTSGKTSFYTTNPNIKGTTYYEGENSTTVPTMLFYLYHSKNLTEEKDLGTVRISVMAITKLNALSNEIKRLVINVNMSSALFQTNEYEGAMTPGDKYELFTSTANNLTTRSKLSAYYALYAENENIYKNGYHRVLSSSYVLPLNTKITMLDFVEGSPEYYYHVITSEDVLNAENEFNREGDCSYPLSMFTRMGSKSNNSNYDDALKNTIYYDGVDSSEEFIFIVDFSDTDIQSNKLNNTLLIEMRDINEESMITVLGIQHSQLTYNLYSNMDSKININAEVSDNPLYIGYNDIFDVSINYQATSLSDTVITDTQYFDNKLGIQIYLKNNEGNVVSGTDLTGTYFEIDGLKYYPDISGYTHIKLSDKVGNTRKWLVFNTENSSLATGNYTFVIEAFASNDGIYYSKGTPQYKNIDISIINSKYGFNPTISEDSTIFESSGNKNLKINITYTSLLDNPNIRIAMYRRKYDEVYDTNYELVDINNYLNQPLTATNNEKEYILKRNPSDTNDFAMLLKENLLTGTYRISFRLYDGDTQIGEIQRYIIIK